MGIDGLSSAGLQQARTPVLDQLIHSGSSTLQAKAILPSYSSPNWASMFNGVTPDYQRITSNVWQDRLLSRQEHCGLGVSKYWPSMFWILRRQEPQADVVCFYEWAGFIRLLEPDAFTHSVHTSNPQNTILQASAYMQTHKPRLLMIHLDLVDHAGHQYGWESVAYTKAVERADSLLGVLIKAVKAADMSPQTAILVTSDHGGTGRGHGGSSAAETTIPWILVGPGIPVDHLITQPVQTYDTAPTLARLLNCPAPACWLGRPVGELGGAIGHIPFGPKATKSP